MFHPIEKTHLNHDVSLGKLSEMVKNICMFLNSVILFLSSNIHPFVINEDFSLFWCNIHNRFKDLQGVRVLYRLYYIIAY